MKCPKCGLENVAGVAFCGRCGARLDSAVKDGADLATLTIETPKPTFMPGRILAGRFEVLEEIGTGGMGTVYRVFDRKVGEEMALKVLRPEVASTPAIVERFKNELKLARRISHKNVCRLYELHEEARIHFITMEFVRGEDLMTRIRRDGPLSARNALDLAGQIAEGLAEAHRLGVVHRDLKPQNIMIDDRGNVRIMDFGIAREAAGPDLTAAGMMVGTPHYMSPEQAAGEAVDPRTDIYALGAILFEMVTGGPPFDASTGLAVAMKHRTEPPPRPRDLNPGISEDLDRLILKCLAKKKEDRYQSARELLSELVRIVGDLSPTAPVVSAFGRAPAAATPAPAPTATPRSTATVSAGEREVIRSIAVLPFKDMSPQRDQDYLCEGLAEELINALAQVKGLKVAARTSAFSFQGKDVDIREIGRQLNVGAILEGSVQKSGNQLRVTTQLICIADGYHLWSDRFDRNIKDIFAVQDEISMAVVEKLRVELLDGEKERVTKRHTRDEKAYELYLKGRYHWNRRSPKDMVMAVDYFQRAIDQDPRYALAYVGIADVFNMLAEFGFIQPQEGYRKSRSLLQKAREIDDSLSELYSSLATITYCYEWDLPAAEGYVRRSIELNPQNMWAHLVCAEVVGVRGRAEEALEEAKTGMEIDPLSPMAHGLYGIVLSYIDEEAGRAYQLKTLAMEPDNPMFHVWLGMDYLGKPAMPDKAVEHLQKAVDLGVSGAYGYLGMAHALAGRKQEAWKCLRKLEKIEKESFVPFPLRLILFLKPGLRHFRSFKKKYCPAYLKASIYCGLNMFDEALTQFEKSSQARDYILPVMLVSMDRYDFPGVEDFVASPRYQALLARIKYN
jgi:TolB-like protein/tRNA A-37 threonylcarbamoyl transferase component Bud32/Tfp pilus assembly protein PilF